MKFDTLSVVVGDRACNANCKFCVSKITCNKPKNVSYNYRRLETAIRLARGFSEVIITGVGEPTLDRTGLGMITQRLHDAGFPIITLQTNGILLAKDLSYAKELYDAGLSRVALSVCHLHPTVNNAIMQAEIPAPLGLCKDLTEIGLSTRLSFIMCKSAFHSAGGYTPENVVTMLDDCVESEWIDQITLREIGGDSDWNQLNYMSLDPLERYLQSAGAQKLLQLHYGARVYDYQGQNVAISNCLTTSTDPDQQRQLIYHPTGRLAFDWSHKGAVLL